MCSKTKNTLTDEQLWNEMRSVAFNRDFEKEIKVFLEALETMEKTDKVYGEIKNDFKKMFLVSC